MKKLKRKKPVYKIKGAVWRAKVGFYSSPQATIFEQGLNTKYLKISEYLN